MINKDGTVEKSNLGNDKSNLLLIILEFVPFLIVLFRVLLLVIHCRSIVIILPFFFFFFLINFHLIIETIKYYL